jgi:hypothetical protein
MMRVINIPRLIAYQELLEIPDTPCLKGRGHKRIMDGDPWRIAWMYIELGQVVEDRLVRSAGLRDGM